MSSLQVTRATDRALVESAEAETRSLYELHGARVHAFCLGRLGDREEAADAVQDTFAKAWLALRDGCEVRQPLAWLLTIAGNVCASRYRAKQARPVETPLHDDAVASFNPQAPAELAGLPTALRALPDEQRRAFVLRELRGCSYEEIGDDLGVSYASVAALLHRSRRAVAASLSGAGRRALAVVPVPQFIRSVFESGAATATVAATTAGVVLLVAPQLGLMPSHNHALPTPPANGAVAPMFGYDTFGYQTTAFPLLRLAGGLLGSREVGSWSSSSRAMTPAGPVRVHAPSLALGGRVAIVPGSDSTVASEPDTPIAPQLPAPAVVGQAPSAASDPGGGPSVAAPQPPASVPATPSGNGQPTVAAPQPPASVPITSRGNGRPAAPGSQGSGQQNTPPGQQNTPPGQQNTPPGQQNTPPGQQTTPPGQQTTPPGQQTTPPGQQTTPPGQGSGQPVDPGSQGNGPPITPPGQGNGQQSTAGDQGNGPGIRDNSGNVPPKESPTGS